ncbi:MAG: Crp/Fnr family transcriptional regulator [Desulfitobacteriaceae bacterium]
MTRESISDEILRLFPFFLDTGTDNIVHSIATIPPGTCAFLEGAHSSEVAFVLKGSLRVIKIGESGREILLYRVLPGESCILQLSSVLAGVGYPANAIVENETEAVMVPAALFKKWINEYQSLRNFVYGNMTKRISSMMALVEEVAFKRMDTRLVELLLNKTSAEQIAVEMTHEEIASELGTAREVVSRLLKNLENDALVELSRGRIRLTNRYGLESILRDM